MLLLSIIAHSIDILFLHEKVAKKKEWKNAMIEEYQCIMNNDVWDVVPRPEGMFDVTSKWIYKIKHVAENFLLTTSIQKYGFFISYNYYFLKLPPMENQNLHSIEQ